MQTSPRARRAPCPLTRAGRPVVASFPLTSRALKIIGAGTATAGLVLILVLTSAPHRVAGQATLLRVIANGETVSSAERAVVQGDVIMIPYQGLFDPLGIRARWDPHERLLTLASPAGDEMELRADDPYATVNGERRPIPIPLVLALDQVLIPVEWVFETLGDETAYDPSTRTLVISPQITTISWRGTDAGLEIAVEGTGPLHARASALHGPERIVLDVVGAVPKTPEQALDVHEGDLATIRAARSALGTRIVLDLTAPLRFRLLTQAPGRRVLVALTSSPIIPGPSGPPSGYHPSARKITDVLYEPVDGGGRVMVMANHPLQVTQRRLRNPDRVVIDVNDAVFLPVKKTLNVEDGLVVQIRAAQFHSNPNVVRIVIEMARPSSFAVHGAPDQGTLEVDLGAALAGVPRPLPPGGPGRHGPAVIAVDAGHGGSDPGAIGPTGVREKDVALAIAQALRRLLIQQHFEVVMVRDADVFVPLEDRARIAARGGATLLVSIHANASTDASKTGTQTFYASPLSQPLAAAVLDEVSRAVGLTPRAETQARFKVLVDSERIPAILVETAFITNAREEQMLRDPATQAAFAQGILRGIERYLSTPPGATP